jgi:DNA polymerase-3 subunit beta
VKVSASGEQRVTIECGRSKFKLLGLPRDEFPTFPVVRFNDSWRVKSGELQKLIAHVAFAVSTEESRPILNGVLWELREERMRMVATNGHRLAKMELPVEASSAPPGDLIVPPKALEQIRRLFPAEEELEIARGDNHLGFRSPFTQVFTRLVEGPYPNYEQVIPKDNERAITVDRLALLDAFRRVAIMSSDKTWGVRIGLDKGRLAIASDNPDAGTAREEIEVAYKGEALEIGFNADFLREGVEGMEGDEVRIGLISPLRPGLLRGESDTHRYLLMPIRLPG